MGKPFPRYPEDVEDGDEPSWAPTKSDHSLLAAERGTQHTKRLETDADGNLYVNVAEGAIDVTVGEVEVKNDVGNPVPVSGTVSVGNFPVTQPVSAASLPLPSGASTEATLALIKAKTDNLDVALSTRTKSSDTQVVSGAVSVSNFPATQNVAVTSTVETEIKNDAGNPVPVSGTITANAGTGPFPVSDNGGSLTVDGTVGVSNFPSVQPVSDNGGSLTVDGTFFQATQPVSAASLPLPSGAATSALQTQPGVDIGDVTINNGSGASGVNVQDGGNSLTVDGSVSVSNFPTTQGVSVDGVSSASLSNVSGSASSVQLLASNASRKMAAFFNDSASACYLKFGTTASLTSFTVKISALGYYELPTPVYTGRIDAIWDTGVGAMRITEL